MKNYKFGIIFIIASFGYLTPFFLMLPYALKAEGWADIILLSISPLLIYGVALIILGIFNITTNFMTMNVLLNCLKGCGYTSFLILAIPGYWNLPFILFLLIPGIFMIYFGFRNEDYYYSSIFTLDIVVFSSLLFLILYITFLILNI